LLGTLLQTSGQAGAPSLAFLVVLFFAFAWPPFQWFLLERTALANALQLGEARQPG
ncbi:MAG: hypothetical protein HY720_00110, partial [Planctomycetes bacterium]|nr:hypothetical protein [Planctomycetota bacterium]